MSTIFSIYVIGDDNKRNTSITSIKQQNFDETEVICVDTYSDISLEIAKGEYVIFLDAGDTVEVNALSSIYRVLTENGVDFYRGSTFYIDSITGNKTSRKDYEGIKKEVFEVPIIFTMYPASLCNIDMTMTSCVYRRQLLLDLRGPFEEISDKRYISFNDRVMLKAQTMFLSKCVIVDHYEIAIEEKTDSEIKKNINELFLEYDRIKEIYNECAVDQRALLLNAVLKKIYDLFSKIKDKYAKNEMSGTIMTFMFDVDCKLIFENVRTVSWLDDFRALLLWGIETETDKGKLGKINAIYKMTPFYSGFYNLVEPDSELLSKNEKKEIERYIKKGKRFLYSNLLKAYAGYFLWEKIKKTRGFDRTAVLLLPDLDIETHYIALLHLDEMLQNRDYDDAIVLTYNPVVLKGARYFSDKILKVIKISQKKAVNLMQFYSLYEFDDRFICASLDEPYGRNGSALIGKRGTTKEEVFMVGIYRIYPFEQSKRPLYKGNDEELKAFFETHGKNVLR